jgi:hypothetical protein
LLITLDTVDRDTPANFAISLKVTTSPPLQVDGTGPITDLSILTRFKGSCLEKSEQKVDKSDVSAALRCQRVLLIKERIIYCSRRLLMVEIAGIFRGIRPFHAERCG